MQNPTTGRSGSSRRPSVLARAAGVVSLIGITTACTAMPASSTTTSGAWQASLGATDLADALDGSVRSLLSDGGTRCYIAGSFTQPEDCVSYWNGSSYEPIGSAAWIGESSANALVWYQGSLHAVGRFMLEAENGSGPIRALAIRLDDSTAPPIWRPVLIADDATSDDEAWAVEAYGGRLYIGGSFTASGTNNLAVLAGSEIDWDQSQHADGTIYALESHGEHLYAGGDFINVGFSSVGVPPDIPPMFFESNLARTSGTNWEEAFSGTDGTVYALHSVESGSNQGLYVGGAFDEIDARSGMDGLARYDGVAVADMDGGVEGSVYAIQRWAGGIAVGGLYQSVGDSGMAAFNIATWDESNGWSAMDSGVFGSVIDAPHGASVLALCSHGNGTSDGVYAGGNFMAHGAEERSNMYAAKFLRVTMVGPSEEYLDDLFNASISALGGPYWEFRQVDDAQPASGRWGVEYARFQRIAWEPSSLAIDEQLRFTPSGEAELDLSIYKEQGPGPFLPPIEVVEFTPRPGHEGNIHSIFCVNSDGEFIELPPIVAAAGLRIHSVESASSVTISNGFFWDRDESYVVEFETPSHIDVSGLAIEDVRALGIARIGQSPDFSSDLELSVIGAVTLDFDRCGFGYQDNLHRLSGADSNVAIWVHGTSLWFEGETGSVLDVVDTQVASNPESRVRAQMSFHMADEFPDWALEIGMLGGIRVGNPADTLTLEREGLDSVLGRFDSGSGQSFFKPDGPDGDAIFFGEQLEFQMIDMSPDTVFTVEASASDPTCIIRWTGPGRCYITGIPGLPPIEGPSGLYIGTVEGADGDDTWDVLQERSLTVTTRRPMRMQILEELFELIEGGPQADPADLNGDGSVDGQDLASLLANWGTADPDADINGDGTVDGQDLASLLAGWD